MVTIKPTQEAYLGRDLFIIIVIMIIMGLILGFDNPSIPLMGAFMCIYAICVRSEFEKLIKKKKRCQICN